MTNIELAEKMIAALAKDNSIGMCIVSFKQSDDLQKALLPAMGIDWNDDNIDQFVNGEASEVEMLAKFIPNGALIDKIIDDIFEGIQ